MYLAPFQTTMVELFWIVNGYKPLADLVKWPTIWLPLESKFPCCLLRQTSKIEIWAKMLAAVHYFCKNALSCSGVLNIPCISKSVCMVKKRTGIIGQESKISIQNFFSKCKTTVSWKLSHCSASALLKISWELHIKVSATDLRYFARS